MYRKEGERLVPEKLRRRKNDEKDDDGKSG